MKDLAVRVDIAKLRHAEKLIHEWMETNQNWISDLVLTSAVDAELSVMDAANYVSNGL